MSITRKSTLAEVAVVVSAALETSGFRAVLTGGACATIYSAGAYQSSDLDFIIQSGSGLRALDRAMATAGFVREGDRYVHAATLFYVEFPRGPLAIGHDVDIRPVNLRVGRGSTWSLSATDACRDRLAAFYHWADRQSLAAAVAIAMKHRVKMTSIRRWSDAEGASEQFVEFRDAVRDQRSRQTPRLRNK